MDDLTARRETLDRLSSSSHDWLQEVVAALPDRADELGTAIQEVERLRNRKLSTMITVALLGGFSSGKTFLASGLQGGLELTMVATGTGSTAEKYVGLLPSAPTPTTACPARIVPVLADGTYDATGRGFLRAQFMDADQQTWEDIGSSLPPPVVAAYAMQGADATGRLSRHWQREVAEVEVLISDYQIPAELYDLPGLGSPNSVHQAIVRSAMKRADCFIYVASATRSLSEDDLDLIKTLYDNYLAYKKPVLWILTAIDRVMDLGLDDQPGWNATIKLDNSYLNENFCPNGEPDTGFIGHGFTPVSPALEARGKLLIEDESLEVKASGRQALAESRMDELRSALGDFIDQETGRVHVAAIASEIQAIVDTWAFAIKSVIYTERIPIDNLSVERWRNQQSIRDLDSRAMRLRDDLISELRRRVSSACAPFDRLPGFMHRLLDEEIKSADLLRQKVSNRIDVLKMSELRNWMVSSTGPAPLWEREFENFRDVTVQGIRNILGAVPENLAAATTDGLEVDRWITLKLSSPSLEQRSVFERASSVMDLAKPVAGAGILAAGGAGISLPFALPVGLAAAAMALLYGVASYQRTKSTSLDVMRSERIATLSSEVEEVRKQFIDAALQQGAEIIDRVLAAITDYRRRLESAVAHIELRMEDPENLQRRQTVESLEPLLSVSSC